MIHDKQYGAVPFGAESMTPDELAPHLVRLQGERAELNDQLDELRQRRDGLGRELYNAKADAERRALVPGTLPPARGKDTPAAAAVKDFVDADPEVLAVKERQTDLARDLATADDRLGAVRSGLRVLLSLIDVARERRERQDLDERAAAAAGQDW